MDSGTGLRTVERALVVLSAFSDERPECGVVELSRELGLDKSQVQRILATLAARGFVTANPATRRYRLGPALLGLGQRAQRSIAMDGEIGPVLHELAQRFRQSAVFNVPDEDKYVCAGAVDFPGPLRYTASVGDPFPGHGGASGHAIFAQLPTGKIELLFPRQLPKLTGNCMTTREALLACYEKVRSRGYAISTGEYDARVMAVAAPVFAAGGVIGSITIAGSAESIREQIDEIVPAVTAAAGRLSGVYPSRQKG